MDMDDRVRITKEVALGREPETPDDEEMAALRKRVQANAEKLKLTGYDLHIPSDWPDPE